MVSQRPDLSHRRDERSDRAVFDRWDRAIQASAERARAEIERQLLSVAADDPQAVILKWALARAEYELGHTVTAAAAMTEALAALSVGGADLHDEVRSMVLLSASAVIAEGGDVTRGLSILDGLAMTDAADLRRKVLIQRAYLLNNAGRLHEAIEVLDHPNLADALDGDNATHLRVRLNRGLVLLQAGELERAEVDFVEAARVARSIGATAAEALCYTNLAVLCARSRRVIESLQGFDHAEGLLAGSSAGHRSRFALEIDRAEVLIGFGMVTDALRAVRRVLDAALLTRNALFIGDAMLLLARVELAANRPARAARTSDATAKYLAEHGRDDMVVHARVVAAIATLRRSTEQTIHRAFETVEPVVAELTALGWTRQVDELALERIRAAWRTDQWAIVGDDLATLGAYRSSSRRDLGVLATFVDAISSGLAGNTAEAITTAYDGLDIVDQIAAETTSLDDRCAAQRLGDDLSGWLVETAILTDDPQTLFGAVEGSRGRTLYEPGEAAPQVGGHGAAAAATAQRLRDSVADRAAVQFAVAGDRLVAVVTTDHQMRRVDLGSLSRICRLRDRVVAWIDQATYEPDGPANQAMAATAKLGDELVGPLDIADRHEIVVAPAPELFGVPWSALPDLASRCVTVTPSFRVWLDALDRVEPSIKSVGYLTGPQIAGNEPELAALSERYREVDGADSAAATAENLRSLLARVDLVHIAAHGTFRADRPMLSTLGLAGGPVTLHDALPDTLNSRIVVLSSCAAGAHVGAGGSEVLGLASVLLARRAVAVVAPLTNVRDLECGEFVADLHHVFAEGNGIAAALAEVRTRWFAADDLSRWAVAASFTCFGAGEIRYATGA